MNEYVHPDEVFCWQNKEWWVRYEPLEHTPVIKCSLVGAIYNGDGEIITFHIGDDGKLTGYQEGLIHCNIGVIYIKYDRKPSEENYLCVSYESGEEEFLSLKSSWLQEGF
jgi:hypothetical protein